MERKLIQTEQEFNEVLEEHKKFLFIKHSLTCPISQAAFDEYTSFDDNSAIPTFYLHVQEAKPLSNYIADTFHVKHESPQALLFEDGKVVWHDSHWSINVKNLEEATK